jgi:hypothetical protein
MNLQHVGFRLHIKKTKRGHTQVLTGHVMYQITEVSDDGQPCAPKNQGQLCVTVWGHCKGQRAHQLQRMEGKSR